MEFQVDVGAVSERLWQVELCQFFTRDRVARYCLNRLTFPRNILSIRLLEPAAGHGAFFLPLVSKLVDACRTQKRSYDSLDPIIRAYEINSRIAHSLRSKCIETLEAVGIETSKAKELARIWVRNEDFLEARIRSRFSHIVGNPPYIRWDAIPKKLRVSYRKRFSCFKQRADLYVAFIEHSLRLLQVGGQLGFLCPSTWTKNTYGGSVREALTSEGYLKTVIDFTDVDSFEKSTDTYPHFFIFEKGSRGATEIFSMAGDEKFCRSGKTVTRSFAASSSPLLLSRHVDAAQTVRRARKKFPSLEDAGCTIRVGVATGCNGVFLGAVPVPPVERDRLLPFASARSIKRGTVKWDKTHIVNVFDKDGKVVPLSRYPRLAAYLRKHKKILKGRAKASKSKVWWRTIDSIQPQWYAAKKLLIVDISASPVIGLDTRGYCAGNSLYQIKSDCWPLKDLFVLLSAGVLGLFVAGLSAGASKGFHRFQKAQIAAIPIPKWNDLDAAWVRRFRTSYKDSDLDSVLDAVAELYECEPDLLAAHVARDWQSIPARTRM